MHFVLRDEVHFQLSKYRFNFSFKDKEFLINYLFVYIVNEKNAMLLCENKNCK